MSKIVFGLAVAFAVTVFGSIQPFCEVWDIPDAPLISLAVPANVKGNAPLRVFCDGRELPSQEISGTGKCVVQFPNDLRDRSKKETLKVSMDKGDGCASGELCVEKPKMAESVVVGTDAFMMTFDSLKNGGLPSRIVWSSGMVCDKVEWEDRVFAHGNDQGLVGVWSLQNGCNGKIFDYGRGKFFRHIRTVGEFAQRNGKTNDAHPRAVYDWIFPNDAPEWVYVHMTYSEEGAGTWDQVHSGVIEFPSGIFTHFDTDGGTGKLPTAGKPTRNSGSRWSAVHANGNFAAVYSAENCSYQDLNRKIIYLHSASRSSYSVGWMGDALVRTGFFRFGHAKKPGKCFDVQPPIAGLNNIRRFDLFANIDAVAEGERMFTWGMPGGLNVNVGIRGGIRAEVKSVKVGDRIIAGRQNLFSIAVEEVDTGKRRVLASDDEWVRIEEIEGGKALRFVGSSGDERLAGLDVVVRCCAAEDGVGCDWTFEGTTGTNAFALAEVTVGAIEMFSTGPKMRALYPGAMGNVKENPIAETTVHRGAYPSLGCAMPWEAVWDEESGHAFYVGAHDPKGGAKYVIMKGQPETCTVRLALTQRLAWNGKNPGAKSVMSGTVAWRSLVGDWYDAAIIYRDWVRDNAVWYPTMGREGRESTPDWFKNLGFIVRTWGYASNVVADVKTCQDFLQVPVMAHWYHWHMIPFDNDYPHYFPAKPGFEEGVQTLHKMGAKAVPYTNGHIWDKRDRGIEDWQFSKIGAKGACMRRDGTLFDEYYSQYETNGEKVVFAPMCPASQVWHDKVGENCHKVVNVSDLDGYYMDQVGAFSTIECRNPAHGHLFGGGSWWQEGYRKLLSDARARCKKKVFFATEGNGEHTFDQIDAFVCWNIEGGVDTVPAFEVCYSGAVNVYCRSNPAAKKKNVREIRMKLANVLADGEMYGWLPAAYCQLEGVKDYMRTCVRFRHMNAPWFYKGEMRRAPRIVETMPEWNVVWDIFGKKRMTRMPVVQSGSRCVFDYDYDSDRKRIWKSARIKGAFLYFTNFSDTDVVTSHIVVDWKDLGIDPKKAVFTRIDEDGRRTPMTHEDFDKPFTFAPGNCFGIECTNCKQ